MIKMSVDAIQNLYDAVVRGDADLAKKAAEAASKVGIDPLVAIEEGLAKGIRKVGDEFECGKRFLVEMMLSAEAMKAAIDILKPRIDEKNKSKYLLGRVVIGTIQTDIHDLGKNIVFMMLSANGFEVTDLGIDVPAKTFVDTAEEVGADIIALSALTTMSVSYFKDVPRLLRERGLREKYKIIVGGSPVNQDLADEVGADAFGRNAVDAVRICKELVRRR